MSRAPAVSSNGPTSRDREGSTTSAGFLVDDEDSSNSRLAKEIDDNLGPLGSPPPPYVAVLNENDKLENDIEDDDEDSPNHPGYVAGKDYCSTDDLDKQPCLEDGGQDVVPITDAAQAGRAAWGGKMEFLLTCVGYAVGLGNVWRFPYLCYKNGGGAFLLPYCIMLITVGLPLFFLELSFGQFASLGPLTIWRISPLFKGLGVAMVMVSFILSTYYNVIVAQCLFFLASSIVGPIFKGGYLPWKNCCNSWNTPYCREFQSRDDNATTTDASVTSNNVTEIACALLNVQPTNESMFSNKTTSAAEEFYERFVLEKTIGLEDMGSLNWKLLIALFVAWVIVILVLLKGIQSLGKVSYFTAFFPYIMLTILLIRGATLEGSINGVIYYLKPDFTHLTNYKVWMEAATQIFFSLSCCNGGLIAMSSYNKFRNNCQRDACLVAFINCGTSVFAGFVIFCNLGFMAYKKGVDVKDVATGGPGLAFVVYPEALTQMPAPPLWAILFFVMMATLGFGSQFSITETVLSAFQDELKSNGIIGTAKWQERVYRVLMCTLLFLLGLCMVFGGGMYILNLVDTVLASFPLMVCGLCEITALMYIYGYTQLASDIKLMVGGKPNPYWRITWCIVTPLIMFGLLILMIVFMEGIVYDTYKYSFAANVVGQLIGVFVIIWIPGYALYKYCKEGGCLLCTEFVKPVEDWGPAKPKHRERFLDTLGGTGDSLDKASSFFQSKLSIAAELQRVASKESGLNRMRTHTNSFSAMHGSASNPQFNIQIDPSLIASAANISSRDCCNKEESSIAARDDGGASCAGDDQPFTMFVGDETGEPSENHQTSV